MQHHQPQHDDDGSGNGGDDLRFRPDAHALGRHPADRRTGTLAVVLALLVGVPLLLWYLHPMRWAGPPPVQEAVAAPAQAEATAAADVGETVIRHPVPAAQAQPPHDLAGALRQLLGAKGLAFLQLTDFPRRVAATVDNLGRSHAPPAAWPVQPTRGRFTVVAAGEEAVIARANAARYTPFVAWVERLDVDRTVAFYRGTYPLFQRAYGELGFGDRYFNDRVVEVIDLLLAAPEPESPVAVRLTEVRGTQLPQRPWVRYEFADPRLHELAAGQKIMVRMGAANQRRIKAKLVAFRQALAGPAAEGTQPR